MFLCLSYLILTYDELDYINLFNVLEFCPLSIQMCEINSWCCIFLNKECISTIYTKITKYENKLSRIYSAIKLEYFSKVTFVEEN